MVIPLKKTERFVWSVIPIVLGFVLFGCAPLYEKANIALEERQYEKALTLYDKQLAKDDNTPEITSITLTGKGYTLEKLNKHDSAVDALSEAFRVYPANDLAVTLKADILSRRGETEQAIKELTAVIARRPSAGALSELGDAYFQRGEIDKAAAAYQKAFAYPAETEIKIRILKGHSHCAFLMREWKVVKSSISKIPREEQNQEDILLLALSCYAIGDKYSTRQTLKRLPVTERLEVIRTLSDISLITDDVILSNRN